VRLKQNTKAPPKFLEHLLWPALGERTEVERLEERADKIEASAERDEALLIEERKTRQASWRNSGRVIHYKDMPSPEIMDDLLAKYRAFYPRGVPLKIHNPKADRVMGGRWAWFRWKNHKNAMVYTFVVDEQDNYVMVVDPDGTPRWESLVTKGGYLTHGFFGFPTDAIICTFLRHGNPHFYCPVCGKPHTTQITPKQLKIKMPIGSKSNISAAWSLCFHIDTLSEWDAADYTAAGLN